MGCSFRVAAMLFGVLAAMDPAVVAGKPPEASPPGEDAPTWVTPAVEAKGVEFRTFDSAAAGTKVSYHVYLPPDYARDETRRFPVVYWLHGTGGGLAGVPKLAEWFDTAIREGKIPPVLVVFPNGLATSLWCDSKDGRMPVETIVVKELVPHIDATCRTLASREGRIIEGFSMGGYGAARLGCKYPGVFGAVSILAAGPLDPEFRGPRAEANPRERERILQTVCGGDLGYFKAQNPRVPAQQNAAALCSGTVIRMATGERDPTLEDNRRFSGELRKLGIPHTFTVPPGVGHNPLALLGALGKANWEFYRKALSPETGNATAGKATGGSGEGRRVFFSFSKARDRDPVLQQQRGWDAVQSIKARMEPLGFDCLLFQEPVKSSGEDAGSPVPSPVSREKILGELESLRKSLGSGDVVIVYSHSHGLQGRLGKPGGLPLDAPGGRGTGPVWLDWREYADQLLRLPARTVVALTMACHSGGLVEFLNSDAQARSQWQARREEGRNFLVITSQDADSLSKPRRIEGDVINPFTYAVMKAFGGAADGFRADGTSGGCDGTITLGELAGYVVDEAKRHHAPGDKSNDPDPQVTGSYDPDFVIATLGSGRGETGE